MKHSAPFEANLSQRAQFEMLTLVGWISCLILLLTVLTRWRHGYRFEAEIMLPIVHLVPWWVGVNEGEDRLRLYSGTGETNKRKRRIFVRQS
jgi:hypothetical protein